MLIRMYENVAAKGLQESESSGSLSKRSPSLHLSFLEILDPPGVGTWARI